MFCVAWEMAAQLTDSFCSLIGMKFPIRCPLKFSNTNVICNFDISTDRPPARNSLVSGHSVDTGEALSVSFNHLNPTGHVTHQPV